MLPIRLMIGGAPKAGTTSLLRYLNQHPALAFHPQHEMTYFLSDQEHAIGEAGAMARYYEAAGTAIPCAKHVMLMYSPKATTRLDAVCPDVRVVLVLRHPVDRAYSGYWYLRSLGRESLPTFEQALAAEPARLENGWEQGRNWAYQFNGDYEPHVRRQFERFGRERVHVYCTEDIAERPLELCRELFAALGVDADFAPQVSHRHNTAAAARSPFVARWIARVLRPGNRLKRAVRRLVPDPLAYRIRHTVLKLNARAFTPRPMDPATRARLLEYFAPSNERLARLLGRNLDAWNR